MHYLIKNIKKLINKLPFKIWKIYVLKKEVLDFFIAKPFFTFEQLKEFILIKIEAPNKGNIIAADPFLHNFDTILFETISKKSGLGEIYKYGFMFSFSNSFNKAKYFFDLWIVNFDLFLESVRRNDLIWDLYPMVFKDPEIRKTKALRKESVRVKK